MGLKRVAATVAILLTIGHTASAEAQKTKPLAFVTEYVREVSEAERLRERAEADNKADGPTMASCVRGMTRLQIEYQDQARMMKTMSLGGRFKDLPGQIAEIYELKSGYLGKFVDGCSAMIAGPKPGVDYGQFAADAPKITANVDALDHALFEMSPLMFGMLIDMRPDREGHASHLTITNAERADLVRDIDVRFGDKEAQDNVTQPVSSVLLLRGFLLKGYKGSDDPW